MKVKLSLTIENNLVEAIKSLAKQNNQSVSEIVSEQKSLLLSSKRHHTISFSKRASGIIIGEKFNDLKQLRDEYLKAEYKL